MPRLLELVFPLAAGLHARPASALRALIDQTRCRARLSNRRTGRAADLRSTLGLISTLTRQGDACTIEFEGEDEAQAAAALERFLREVLPHLDDGGLAPPAAASRPLPRALARCGAVVVAGAPVAAGVGRGRAVVRRGALAPPEPPPRRGGPDVEREALQQALAAVRARLGAQRAGVQGSAARAVLEAHLAILDDPELLARTGAAIAAGASAGEAVRDGAAHFAGVLRESGSELLAERAADLLELASALLVALGASPAAAALPLPEDAILVVEQLGPAELLALDGTRLRGLVLGAVGATSHVAILARAAGIPCVALPAAPRRLTAGAELVVDGARGLVVVETTPSVESFYARETAVQDAIMARRQALCGLPGATADGRRVEIAANAAGEGEAARAFEQGADGIGLLRTEALFIGRAEPPGEDEQAAVYAAVVRVAAGRPVIIRTIDAGGDKPVAGLALPAEPNPFLGWRAVRTYAAHEDVIAAQVRAILRASAEGPVRLMVPMVASRSEVDGVRALVEREKGNLRERGVAFDEALAIGIMVEVPAAALTVDLLAASADFFSIGSNDLTQYVLAADRGNPAVASLYDPLHPAVLRLLARVVEDGHAHGRPVGLCGELAGELAAVPLLVGLGLDELSVAPAQVLAVKAAVAACDSRACIELARAAMGAGGGAAVRALLATWPTAMPRPLVEPSTVALASGAADKDAAIRELVDLLYMAGRVDDGDAVEEAVWAREAVASTAVGLGIAVPHCASPHVRAASLALARYQRPLPWGAGADEVEMAILIAVGADAADAHLRLIATLSRRLMDDDFRAALQAATAPAAAAALLLNALEQGGC